MGFSLLDYAILVLYLLATAALGILLGRGRKDLGQYFLAGRNLPWWVVCLSIVATETSTLTFIGVPALSYTGNFTFLQLVLGYVVGRVLVSFLLVPAYFKQRLQTAYQLLAHRLGKGVRNFSAFLFLGTRSLADGVRLFSTGLVLSVVTGLSDFWAVVLIGAVTVAYTYYGGMLSVIFNDVVQLVVYLAGAVIALYVLLEKIPGGWSQAIGEAQLHGKLQVFDFDLALATPYTFWAGLVGGAFLTLATHGTDQMMVQRYLSSGSPRRSQIALIASGVVILAQFGLFLLLGVLLFVFYKNFPLDQELVQTDRIFPIFIVQELPSGISGLIIAAIFAAAMSTLSSSLNSLSASSIHDFYRRWRHGTEAHYLRVSRLLTLGWCGILVAIALLARNWGSVLEAGLTIPSLTMGSVLGVFLLALRRRKITQKGALTGMAAGLATMLAIHWTGAVAWPWYVLVGTSVTFTTGWTVSRLGGGNPVSGH